MATKKRVYAETDGVPATQIDSRDEGSESGAVAGMAEVQTLHKRVKELQKEFADLSEKYEALNHMLYDFGADGKKFCVPKKCLGMANFHHRWIKNAEEKMPDLKLPEQGGSDWKK